MQKLKVTRFVPSDESLVVVRKIANRSGEGRDAHEMLDLASFMGRPFEIVMVMPGERFTLPDSEQDRPERLIQFAGEKPVLEPRNDFGNQASLRASSALGVVYFTKREPGGKIKFFTTVKR